MPPAATVKLALVPAATAWSEGCREKEGPTRAAFTVRSAAALARVPTLLVILQRNWVPLSPTEVAPVPWLAPVAPATSVQMTPSGLDCH